MAIHLQWVVRHAVQLTHLIDLKWVGLESPDMCEAEKSDMRPDKQLLV